MSDPERALTERSDQLLQALAHLRALESQKRLVDISSPEFRALADEVTEVSRRIFEIAAQQDKLGAEAAGTSQSIEDIAREG
jgi:hypothetical protein